MIEEKYWSLLPKDLKDICLEYSKTDEFIGSRFGENGHLEVLGWFGEKVNKHVKVYLVKCHECAKDPELFEDGIFRSLKDNLKKGRIPCMCKSNKGLSPEQLEILIKRKIKDSGYSFVKLIEKDKLENHSATLSCDKHGEFDVISAYRFLKVGSKCPHCTSEKIISIFKKDDSHFIKSFFATGKFHKDTKFIKSDKTYKTKYSFYNYWKVICPVCSNDEYVKNGLCSGKFYSRSCNLQTGNLPCRCSGQYSWNTAQREYQVKSIIDKNKLDIEFVGWFNTEKYKNYKSRIILKCKEHGEYDIAIDNFLQGYTRCPICAGKGYSKYVTGYLYIVRWYSEDISFYKLGISNSPKHRFKQQQRSNNLKYEVYKIFEFKDGSIPLNIESNCKSMFNLGVVKQDIMPDGYSETFNSDILHDIEDYINNFIKEVE